MQDELTRNRCAAETLDVWQRGVDTQLFHPRHRTTAMRARMSDGHPDDTILIYIGRLGAGESLELIFLRARLLCRSLADVAVIRFRPLPNLHSRHGLLRYLACGSSLCALFVLGGAWNVNLILHYVIRT